MHFIYQSGHYPKVLAAFGKLCHTGSKSIFKQAKLMATMNVSLPDPMKDWVESQVKSGKYANSSDYVRDLIRQDQVVQEKRHALIQALIQGEESGSAGKLDMEEIKQKARQRAVLTSPNA
jgi:antitoxin ParD1/3/4